MILSIHQPHIFPWLGYFDKMLKSDHFIYLDNVQFSKNYFQNRTKIKSFKGEEEWLTIPIKKAPLETLIKEIELSETYKIKLIEQKLKQNYAKADFMELYLDKILQIFNEQHFELSILNINSTEFVLNQIGIGPNRMTASNLSVNETDANLRLIKYCHALNCDVYLSGSGGKKYMDLELFKKSGIEVKFQDFQPDKNSYKQINGNFLPGLSVIDILLNVGNIGLLDLLTKK
jgi:hypothetical protein